ncbi:MOSC domain-containing protein [Virgibacillus xinjiangensis]|uniref:MOSC domain-containing protein n=1 Tax=Virgibacillus xinjiangensis TaxID=393090 RepID=A0ABV7CT25_9BACI
MDEPFVHKIFSGMVQQKREGAMPFPWRLTIAETMELESARIQTRGIKNKSRLYRTPDKALFAYPIKHYADWQTELADESISYGAMGEHLSLLEMEEYTVCIGDVFHLGTAVIQVSQPGLPYLDATTPFRHIGFSRRIQKSGRTGWYFRVLEEGEAHCSTDLELMERLSPAWTIAACNEVMHVRKEDLRLAEDLAACEGLGESWKKALNKRIRGY